MRWGMGIALALALCGCSKDKRGARHADTGVARPTADATDAATAAPSAKFDADGWNGLGWSATPDDARAILTAAGITFKEEEMRAYLEPAPGRPMHTNGLTFQFKRPPLHGSVSFESWKLEGVSFHGEHPFTREQALAEQAALERRFGPPTERAGTADANVLTWRNATTVLSSHLQPAADPDKWGYLESWLPVPTDAGTR